MKLKTPTKEESELIMKIADYHSNSRYAYMEKEDLASEIFLICMQALPHYKKRLGPLENFLRKTVKNRMANLFNQKMGALRRPCNSCKYHDENSPSECSKFGDNRHECKKWNKYSLSMTSRNSLMTSAETLGDRVDEKEASFSMMTQELIEQLRKELPKGLLNDFNRLVNNEKISKIKLQKIASAVKEIIKD